MNKRKREVHDLAICETEAAVVREMFHRAYTFGNGAQAIANHLNSHGYKNRSGKNWHPATIHAILKNVMYIGILRGGETVSPVQEHLRIIDDKTFESVKAMLESRSQKYQDSRSIPLNTRGNFLMSGNIFCGHCGARLCVTTSGKGYRRKSDGVDVMRTRYCCQTRTRKHEDCGGQTGYTVSKVDKIIETLVLDIFRKVRDIRRDEILASCNQRDLQARKSHIDELRRDLAKAESDMQRLREEIVKSLTGDSVFSPELLKTTIDTQEQKCLELGQKLQTAESELSDSEGRIRNISERFDDILEWSGIFRHADMATKKMIVSRLIDRVDIRAGYDVKVTLNISVEQFLNGIEVQ